MSAGPARWIEEARELRAAVAGLLEALVMLRGYGCPACSGDCGSANPPVAFCPMQQVSAAISQAGDRA